MSRRSARRIRAWYRTGNRRRNRGRVRAAPKYKKTHCEKVERGAHDGVVRCQIAAPAVCEFEAARVEVGRQRQRGMALRGAERRIETVAERRACAIAQKFGNGPSTDQAEVLMRCDSSGRSSGTSSANSQGFVAGIRVTS